MTLALITGDIHLTDLPRDEYRWSIFPWLARQAENRDCDTIIIAGDLTDRKDLHPGRLVNRIVEHVEQLCKSFRVYVVMGNHDYDQDPKMPFFRFAPWFVHERTVVDIGGRRVLLHPYIRRFQGKGDFTDFDMIVLHQTFNGAVASNGFPMEGCSRKVFSKKKVGPDCLVVSGDIHVPQRVGNITYAGAPHPITFGDSYQPRVLAWTGSKLKSIRRTTIRKAIVKIDGPDEHEKLMSYDEGDQVKIRYRLPRRDFHEWDSTKLALREMCDRGGIELHGMSLDELPVRARRQLVDEDEQEQSIDSLVSSKDNVSIFEDFCDSEGIDKTLRRAGRELLA